jgi:RimJ/RimL family protein N-acetyltransferase
VDSGDLIRKTGRTTTMDIRLVTQITAQEVRRMLSYWQSEPALQKHEEHCEWLEDTIFHVTDPQTDVTLKLQNPPDFIFYMIYDGDMHVGFVEAFSRPFDFHGLSIDITSICIFQEYRGNGYVGKALNLLISELFENFPNAKHISCQTTLSNKPMVKHLLQFGFQRKESTKVGEIFLYERSND